MTILGLDIGGANIKAANLEGRAVSRPFAIWRQPHRLIDELYLVFEQFPLTSRVALTMTAELADCFSTKTEGVRFIIDAVETSVRRICPTNVEASTIQRQTQVIVWSTHGRFLIPDTAKTNILQVAAANWHALATWCARLVPDRPGLLVDVGTTTTDIIPLVDGRPASTGFTDISRLESGELSYSGVWRTPLCAIAHSVPFRDGYCPLAAELFATTLDIYLLLGQILEDAISVDTANGKPATKAAAHDRIARMLCCDRDEVSLDEAVDIARFLADVQRQRLAGSLERVLQRLSSYCQFVIVSGSGSFLARQLIAENRRTATCELISLANRLSEGVSEAACAFAVAQLASSLNGGGAPSEASVPLVPSVP